MFSYLSRWDIPEPTYAIMVEATDQIATRVSRITKDMFAIGVLLLDVKQALNNQPAFELWIGEEFGWEIRTAQRWIAVVKTVSSYGLLDKFLSGEYEAQKSALYELSSNRVDDEGRRKAFRALMGGERLTYNMVVALTRPVHNMVTTASMGSTASPDVQTAISKAEPGSVKANTIAQLEKLGREDPEALDDVIRSGAVETTNGGQVELSEVRDDDFQGLIDLIRGERRNRKFTELVEELSVAIVTVYTNELAEGTDEFCKVVVKYYRPEEAPIYDGRDGVGGELGTYPTNFFYKWQTPRVKRGKTVLETGEQEYHIALPAAHLDVLFVAKK